MAELQYVPFAKHRQRCNQNFGIGMVAGILCCWLAAAGVLLVLRDAGHVCGFQCQPPLHVDQRGRKGDG